MRDPGFRRAHPKWVRIRVQLSQKRPRKCCPDERVAGCGVGLGSRCGPASSGRTTEYHVAIPTWYTYANGDEGKPQPAAPQSPQKERSQPHFPYSKYPKTLLWPPNCTSCGPWIGVLVPRGRPRKSLRDLRRGGLHEAARAQISFRGGAFQDFNVGVGKSKGAAPIGKSLRTSPGALPIAVDAPVGSKVL